MKIFVREEYSDLDEVGGLTLKNSVLNQANILQELKNHQEEMAVRMEQNFKINMIETMSGLCKQIGNEENHQPANPSNTAHVNETSANNLSSSDKAIFQFLKTLQDKVAALSATNNNSYTPIVNSQVKESKSGPVINSATG